MEKLTIDGNWDKKRTKLKQKFAGLTDDDLNYTEGEEEELVGRIQQRLEVPEEIAQKIIRYPGLPIIFFLLSAMGGPFLYITSFLRMKTLNKKDYAY